MTGRPPLVVLLAGPNGAGKSTAAARPIRGALVVEDFVNADTIAAGLSAYRPESVAIAAGRVMLARLHQLAAEPPRLHFNRSSLPLRRIRLR